MATTALSDVLTFAPAAWPGGKQELQPGDLTQFAPSGLGMGAPLVMMPWDNLEDVLNRPNYYGFNKPSAHPFENAPANEGCGGIIYFDRVTRKTLDATLELLNVGVHIQEFFAFWQRSEDPVHDRYVEQLRLMSKSSISIFGAQLSAECEQFMKQKITLGEALWAFIENQQAVYEKGDMYPASLSGLLGGDGDWAKEALAFGFMVENSYNSIYRIWSRAHLVTK